jgi:thiosulfate dehydrogenase [quinone] large subunit
MMISLIESAKFMGHLWPVALFRMTVGFWIFTKAHHYWYTGFFEQPLIEKVLEQLWIKGADPEKLHFLQNYFAPYWVAINYTVLCSVFLIGICYMLGFLVRPIALLAICFVSLHYAIFNQGQSSEMYQLAIAVHILFFLIGAGSLCLV